MHCVLMRNSKDEIKAAMRSAVQFVLSIAAYIYYLYLILYTKIVEDNTKVMALAMIRL
jgi:hypothetical protein